MQKSKLWTKDFLAVSLTSFFVFVIFYMLTVTLPLFATDELHASKQSLGLIVTIFLVSGIVFRPLAGKWMTTLGQKKVLLIGVFIFLIGSILYMNIHSLSALLLLRVLHGIGFGMSTTATGAIVANVIPEQRKGEGMGYYATFMNLAMVVGPFVGLTLTNTLGHAAVFTVAIVSSVLAALCSLVLRVPEVEPASSATNKIQPAKGLAAFFEYRSLPISVAGLVVAFSYASVISFVSMYAKEMGFTQASSFFFVVYAVCLLASRPFTGKWFDQYGENSVVYPSILSLAIGIFLLSQATTSWVFLLAGALIGLGFGTITSSFQSIAVKKASPHRRGVATATFFVFFDSGMGLGSFLLGILSTAAGYKGMYVFCSIVALLAIAVYLVLHGRKSQKQRIISQNESLGK
ncbi:MFS transporter [Priestia aryabhattai]|uniref:MFS transporter n=1 Tax=Priestia TaxID=2800373 RepID=UPI00064F6C1C|nr:MULTISPECIES: MFS transporter [Priestia]KML27510.1 multidrug MFS transporter [Priestia aryabhattai]KMO00402.1 multidrug MFS transporter [Priestia aryabhattai]KZE14806.1 multidrug MFS transporter [Priestia aryabhattai]MBY0007310.1 MFS transporter [Priestia aryabhattai]MBY0048814.1 MFS transporter [Priestia aryabhattai]